MDLHLNFPSFQIEGINKNRKKTNLIKEVALDLFATIFYSGYESILESVMKNTKIEIDDFLDKNNKIPNFTKLSNEIERMSLVEFLKLDVKVRLVVFELFTKEKQNRFIQLVVLELFTKEKQNRFIQYLPHSGDFSIDSSNISRDEIHMSDLMPNSNRNYKSVLNAMNAKYENRRNKVLSTELP